MASIANRQHIKQTVEAGKCKKKLDFQGIINQSTSLPAL